MTKIELVKNCPVCGCDRFVKGHIVIKYGKNEEFGFSECDVCSAVFLSKRIEESEISLAYADNYEPYSDKASLLKELFWWWRDGREARYIKSHKPDAKCLLEIGSSWGRYLLSMKEKLGLEVVGIEIGEEAAKVGQAKYGLDIRFGVLDSQNFSDDKFDVVVMNHVLEHLYCPKQTLVKVFNMMVSRGLLLIKTPNTESLERRIFGRHWGPYDVPRHISLFSEKTMKAVLTDCGFKDISISYETLPNDIILSIKNFMNSQGLPRVVCDFFTIKNPLVVLAFFPVSFVLGLFTKSSRMVVWARRP